MNLIVTDNYEELSRVGADVIAELIAAKPDAVLVLATGDTPMGVYRELTARWERGELDTSRLRVFQLDEYLGVPEDDDRSLYGWMEGSFVRPLGIAHANVVRLPWDAAQADAGCEAYDEA